MGEQREIDLLVFVVGRQEGRELLTDIVGDPLEALFEQLTDLLEFLIVAVGFQQVDGVQVLLGSDLPSLRYHIIPLLQHVHVLLHVGVLRPPLEMLEGVDSLMDTVADLRYYLLAGRSELQPLAADVGNEPALLHWNFVGLVGWVLLGKHVHVVQQGELLLTLGIGHGEIECSHILINEVLWFDALHVYGRHQLDLQQAFRVHGGHHRTAVVDGLLVQNFDVGVRMQLL